MEPEVKGCSSNYWSELTPLQHTTPTPTPIIYIIIGVGVRKQLERCVTPIGVTPTIFGVFGVKPGGRLFD
jgi:hypothetical protein